MSRPTTARVTPDLLKALRSHSETQKKGHISRGDQQAYYLFIYLFIYLFVFLLIKTLLTTERVPTGR